MTGRGLRARSTKGHDPFYMMAVLQLLSQARCIWLFKRGLGTELSAF